MQFSGVQVLLLVLGVWQLGWKKFSVSQGSDDVLFLMCFTKLMELQMSWLERGCLVAFVLISFFCSFFSYCFFFYYC